MSTHLVPLGILLPESVLQSTWFAVLSAFVALNTVMYVTLAMMKSLPVIRPVRRRKSFTARAQTRSIHPDPGATSSPDLL